MKYFCIILVILITTSCQKWLESGDNDIRIYNQSIDTIVFFHMSSDVHNLYDTILRPKKNEYNFSSIDNSTLPQTIGVGMIWSSDIDVSRDTMTIFIIKNSVYNNVPWDTIVKNYQILQRYDVPAQYYIDNFSYLTYPPSPEMREIPMYPPYKE